MLTRALGGWLCGLAALVVYAGTVCRSVWVGDAPEFALAAACAGVPHPPGYPLHTLLAAGFVRLWPGANWALAANAFSALCAALAVVATYGVARALGAGAVAAAGGALSLAFATTFWSQAGAAEVYALDTLLLSLALLAALRVRAAPSRARLVVAALALGAWVGHRPVNVLLLGFVVALGGRRPWRMPGAARSWALAVGAAAATGLVYLYLPLASARDPALDIGDPERWPEFWTVVSASTYRRHLQSGTAELAWARFTDACANLPLELGCAALFAVGGFVHLWRTQRGVALALLGLVAVNLGFSANYNILDIAAYLLPTHAVLAALAAVGATRWLGRHAWLLAVAAAALLPWHWRACDLSRFDLVARYARDVLTQAAPNALLFCSGDSSTHALWYLQAVEGVRRDVVVVSPGHVHPWYVKQLLARHPQMSWPPLAEIAAGTWTQSLLRRALRERPVCLLEPPELRLPGLGAPDLVEVVRGVPAGPAYQLHGYDQALPAPLLARARDYWRSATIPTAASLDGADVQLAMVAFSMHVAFYSFAALLAEQGELDGAVAALRRLVDAQPDAIEAQIAQAYASIGRRPPRLGLGERGARALAAGSRAAMLQALAGQ